MAIDYPKVTKRWRRKCHVCCNPDGLFYAYPLPRLVAPYLFTGWLLCPRHLKVWEAGRLERLVKLLAAVSRKEHWWITN